MNDFLWYAAAAAELAVGIGIGWLARGAWQRYSMARDTARQQAFTRELFDRHPGGLN
jgi:hypothetical protein